MWFLRNIQISRVLFNKCKEFGLLMSLQDDIQQKAINVEEMIEEYKRIHKVYDDVENKVNELETKLEKQDVLRGVRNYYSELNNKIYNLLGFMHKERFYEIVGPHDNSEALDFLYTEISDFFHIERQLAYGWYSFIPFISIMGRIRTKEASINDKVPFYFSRFDVFWEGVDKHVIRMSYGDFLFELGTILNKTIEGIDPIVSGNNAVLFALIGHDDLYKYWPEIFYYELNIEDVDE